MGVVSAAVYASKGHQVVGLDIDLSKIKQLNKGEVPFFEPDLEKLLRAQLMSGNLKFTADYQEAISQSQLVIIAVGTPSAPDGQADLKFVKASASSLAPHLKEGAIVAIKSTVPPGTLELIEDIIGKQTTVRFTSASLPEFLREGSAVADSLHPDRVVIGASDRATAKTLEELHRDFDCPVIKVSPESAQMGKYTANAYLATRITFINQIADLCQKNGANIEEVIEIIGHDKRIGHHYWYPGFGYGGSCFPKDVNELAAYSKSIGEEHNLLNKITDLNQSRIPRLMKWYEEWLGGFKGKTVAVLGLSFKPHTNDMREAPSTRVIPWLLEAGSKVKAFDPKALPTVDHFIKSNQNLSYFDQIELAIKEADVIIPLIEWPEIIEFDFTAHREDKDQYFIDARNQFEADKLIEAGYHYRGVGYGS